MRTWELINIVTGIFRMPCDDCGSTCRRRYDVIRNRDTGEVMNVGSDCGFRRTGMKDPVPAAYADSDAIGEIPDWML